MCVSSAQELPKGREPVFYNEAEPVLREDPASLGLLPREQALLPPHLPTPGGPRSSGSELGFSVTCCTLSLTDLGKSWLPRPQRATNLRDSITGGPGSDSVQSPLQGPQDRGAQVSWQIGIAREL